MFHAGWEGRFPNRPSSHPYRPPHPNRPARGQPPSNGSPFFGSARSQKLALSLSGGGGVHIDRLSFELFKHPTNSCQPFVFHFLSSPLRRNAGRDSNCRKLGLCMPSLHAGNGCVEGRPLCSFASLFEHLCSFGIESLTAAAGNAEIIV